jgi:hypothetical protein
MHPYSAGFPAKRASGAISFLKFFQKLSTLVCGMFVDGCGKLFDRIGPVEKPKFLSPPPVDGQIVGSQGFPQVFHTFFLYGYCY